MRRRVVAALGGSLLLFLCSCGELFGPDIASVEVSPNPLTLSALGETAQLTAVARSASGKPLGGKNFSWSSSNPSVATVDVQRGLVTAVSNGTATIRATTEDVAGEAALSVEQAVAQVEVSPGTAMLTALEDTTRLAALGKDQRGNPMPGLAIMWSSANPLIASVDSAGLVTAVANGAASITAVIGDGSGAAVVTVAQQVDTVRITPDSVVIWPGDTVRLAAWLFDSRGHPVTGRTVSWATADTAVATIDPSGLVLATAVRLGPVSIRATSGTRSDTAWVSSETRFQSPAAGGSYTCALSIDGTAYCWGSYSGGQFGDPGVRVPTLLPGEVQFTALSAGREHTCGMVQSGAAYCWGYNYDGQLGNGTTAHSATPSPVYGNLSFSSLSAGERHTCAVTISGTGYCWGANHAWQLGNGTTTGMTVPTAVTASFPFLVISAGSQHTCGVAGDSLGYCWGANTYGELGTGTPFTATTPAAVYGGMRFAGISASQLDSHTCAWSSALRAYCWGLNRAGQVGDGTVDDRNTPQVLAGDPSFESVWASAYRSCGIAPGGAAYCWGANSSGSLGDGTSQSRQLPTAVLGGLSFSSLSLGDSHTCGVTTGGALYCWGTNGRNQLGTGEGGSSVPVRVLGSRP